MHLIQLSYEPSLKCADAPVTKQNNLPIQAIEGRYHVTAVCRPFFSFFLRSVHAYP